VQQFKSRFATVQGSRASVKRVQEFFRRCVTRWFKKKSAEGTIEINDDALSCLRLFCAVIMGAEGAGKQGWSPSEAMKPCDDVAEDFFRDGLLDDSVLGRSARGGVLEQVVEGRV